MSLDIDCEDLSCITFADITKAYSLSNPTGYGGPNTPSLEEILSVVFVITYNGVQYVNNSSTYLPNADGTTTVCLKASDFLSVYDDTPLTFVKGATYSLQYILELGASVEVNATPQTFKYPCCGDAVTSNLGTSFTITEKLGCSSFDFKDTTGTYNATTNPGGYGTPNAAYADIISTLIKVTLADGTIKEITDFIPTALNQTKNINAQTLGYSDQILPQVVTIEYSVYVAGSCRVGYKKTKVLLHCVLRNCIVSKGKSVLVTDCGSCDNGEVKVTISLIHRYEMLLLASYDNIDCIQNEVEALYDECKKYCGCS